MGLFHSFFNGQGIYFNAFEQMVEAVYICDIDRNLIYFNKVAEQLDGYLLSEVKGHSVYELYGLRDMDSPMLKALVTECPVYNEEYSYYVNGREVIQICNAGPIYEDGTLVGAYTIQRDLTMYKEMVEQNIMLQKEINHHKSMIMDSSENDPFSTIIGKSDAFRYCVDLARQASRTGSSVMLVGRTGSGKEIFAKAIHDSSDRGKKPFLALNCAAIPETLIESLLFGTTKGVYTGAVEKDGILAQADGGTVFLDEINSMPLDSQAKLLRVLEEKKIMKMGSNKELPIDIRIISSTNEDPIEAIRNHHIREDLFYRLSVVQIQIPSLRERKDDIPLLVDFFIAKYNNRFHKEVCGVESAVMSMFMDFPWPGNVRQLKACIESAMNFAPQKGWIRFHDLPAYIFEDNEVPENRYRQLLQKNWRAEDPSGIKTGHAVSSWKRSETFPAYPIPFSAALKNKPFPKPEEELDVPFVKKEPSVMETIRNNEKEEIIAALKSYRGNITKAASFLGMSRQSLSYRIKKYNLK